MLNYYFLKLQKTNATHFFNCFDVNFIHFLQKAACLFNYSQFFFVKKRYIGYKQAGLA